MSFSSDWLKKQAGAGAAGDGGGRGEGGSGVSAAASSVASSVSGLAGRVGGFFGAKGTELPMTVESSTDRTSSSSSSSSSWFSSSPASSGEGWLELSRGERLKVFVILILVSFGFFGLAAFVFAPMMVLFPAKFALSFTTGSILFMAAFAILRGIKEHFKSICSKERIPFTLAYFGSLAGTLWAVLVLRSNFRYFVVIGFVGVQVRLAKDGWGGRAVRDPRDRHASIGGRARFLTLFRPPIPRPSSLRPVAVGSM